ncbi:MAG: helix-turn-helix transcriptional regulator [Clostridiaceae bacterium]
MQINRLFDIIMILLNKETVTAKELAEHFGVSTRTIYRDIDTLSLSNVPIYTNKGSGGGISILPEFTIDKSLLSEKEQGEIISALHSIKAAKYPETDSIITKLGAVFKNTNNYNWVEVDFSHWGSGEEERNKFNNLKDAILSRNVVEFEYVNSYGKITNRSVEPIKLVFKGQAWYLQGFCQNKKDNRIFRISRIRNLKVSKTVFNPSDLSSLKMDITYIPDYETVTLRFKFKPEILYRVYDEFRYENIKHNEDGTVEATTTFPKGDWIYGYILSFGPLAEVLEPEDMRTEIKELLNTTLNIYQ